MAIRIQKQTFHCRFTTRAHLPGYLGSTLRGALGWALKKAGCALPGQECGPCLLKNSCGYYYLFETEAYQDADGRPVNARPHPIILEPESTAPGEQQVGDTFSFSLVLMDRAIDHLPLISEAVNLMGEQGIGSSRGRHRGRFDLVRIQPRDGLLSLENFRDSGVHSIYVRLHTPLRIKRHNRMLKQLPFAELIRACLRRVAALEEAYGPGEPDLDYPGLVRAAGRVRQQQHDLHWHSLQRWSNRQGKKVSLDGLLGTSSYSGDLTRFMPLLRY